MGVFAHADHRAADRSHGVAGKRGEGSNLALKADLHCSRLLHGAGFQVIGFGSWECIVQGSSVDPPCIRWFADDLVVFAFEFREGRGCAAKLDWDQSTESMGYIYYCYIGLLPKDSTASVAELQSRLDDRLKRQTRGFSITLIESHLSLKVEGFTFDIHFVDGPHVLEESGDMAKYYSGNDPAEKATIASATTRLEMSGEYDPNMDFFNDSITILECWEAMGIVHVFDPFGGKFLDR